MDTRRVRRGPLLRTVLRVALTTAALLGAFFAAPLTRSFTATSAVVLSALLAALAGLMGWQARAIVRARSPRLRTAEALATSVPVFVLAFATGYCLLANNDPPGFSERLTHVDSLYFTITVFSSVGFGDIVPVSQAARGLTTVQMLGDLVFLGFAAKVFLEAMRRGIERRSHDPDHPPDAPR
ncbi:potassium channel family protein [Actinomadura decatromicini]|uniref:Two pore domain potassium channel family protein n=1 Tax=Actinomadura decatromicini TaxID=2604572 RepID=A0A5D3FD30_9ACTN|nr:potassium channel family protein [Actinomadura decatromicini]TYK46797.1 two pore domain potassium channel family protein [Actinomadura decatromicini]